MKDKTKFNYPLDDTPFVAEIHQIKSMLKIELVSRTEFEPLWDQLVADYHDLGHGKTMNNASLPKQYKQVYACFGLAIPTPFNGVEYPQLIGLHTNPPVQPLASYPDC